MKRELSLDSINLNDPSNIKAIKVEPVELTIQENENLSSNASGKQLATNLPIINKADKDSSDTSQEIQIPVCTNTIHKALSNEKLGSIASDESDVNKNVLYNYL